MKIEEKVWERFEKTTNMLTELTDSLGDSKQATEDQRVSVAFMTGMLFAFAFALDCEESLKSIIQAMKLQAIADKMGA